MYDDVIHKGRICYIFFLNQFINNSNQETVMENELQKYLDALEAGDSALLEELAIKAGYVKKDDRLLQFHLARIQMETDYAIINSKVEKDVDISNEEWDIFCESRKQFLETLGRDVELDVVDCALLRPSLAINIEMKERWRSRVEMLLLMVRVHLSQVCDFWTIGDFIRFRPGPAPFKRSFVSFIFSNVDNSQDSRFLRNFALDVYDKNCSLWMNLLRVGSSVKFVRIADDVEANGPYEHTRFRRELANATLVSKKCENLVCGRKAVEYLYDLSQGRDSDLFPLSKGGYENLIEEHQRNLETWKAKNRHSHDPEYVRRALRRLKRWIKQKHGRFAISNWKNLNKADLSELHECIALQTTDEDERKLTRLIRRFQFAYPEK